MFQVSVANSHPSCRKSTFEATLAVLPPLAVPSSNEQAREPLLSFLPKQMRRKKSLIAPPATSPTVAAVMRANKKWDTRPELRVRKILRTLGYRYRVHSRQLPGTPDIVFASRRKLIFIHGCFWHQHQSKRCPLRSHPRSNLEYWQPKLRRNVLRDKRNARKLAKLGWQVLTVWECELAKPETIAKKLSCFLE
jgi:DNA mismatch endonuclease (patch repair protein)